MRHSPFSSHLVPLFLSALLCLAARAETWTSANGEVIEADFIGYNIDRGEISISRNSDKRVFVLPEAQLSQADRLKAIALQNKGVEPYWFTDYATMQGDNPRNRFLVLYANGADAEAFELFCRKLLLREEFRTLLQSRYFLACITDSIPSDWVDLVVAKGSQTQRLTERQPGIPLAFYGDVILEEFQHMRGAQHVLLLNGEKPDSTTRTPKLSDAAAIALIDKAIRAEKPTKEADRY